MAKIDFSKYDDKSDSARDLIFYYDETNNIRKLIIKEKGDEIGFNNELEDFILGGIAVENNRNVNAEELFKKCGLSKSKDVKSRSFFKYSDFVKNMESDRVTALMEWLVDNNIYIHYYSQDNLYFALVDIVDSVLYYMATTGMNIDMLSFQIKSSFYTFAVSNQEPILRILKKYSFPDVRKEDIPKLCEDIINLIGEYDPYNEDFLLETLRQCLKTIIRDDADLVFIHDEDEGVLSNHYEMSYVSRMNDAPHCKHIFDREENVIKYIEANEIMYKGIPYTNYMFVDSADERLIQVSDAVVKLLDRYFRFLKSVNYYIPRKSLSDISLENLRRFKLIIDRSHERSIYLFNSFGPTDYISKRWTALDALFMRKKPIKAGTRTLDEFESFKDKKCPPFENAYECYILSLMDDYISKPDGKQRIMCELEDWNTDVQKHIVAILVRELHAMGLNDHRIQELLDTIEDG